MGIRITRFAVRLSGACFMLWISSAVGLRPAPVFAVPPHTHAHESHEPQHTHERAGQPLTLGRFVEPLRTPEYRGYAVGGAVPFGGRHTYRPPYPYQFVDKLTGEIHPEPISPVMTSRRDPRWAGTFGYDFQGLKTPRSIVLRNAFGMRRQGGSGAYRTDGPHVPDIFAFRLFSHHHHHQEEAESEAAVMHP